MTSVKHQPELVHSPAPWSPRPVRRRWRRPLAIGLGLIAWPLLAFFVAVGAWAIARTLVATTWRDPTTIGPFRTEQVVDLLIVAGCVVAVAVLLRRERRASPAAATG